MNFAFADQRPEAATATAYVVAKKDWEKFDSGLKHHEFLVDAAKSARFEGKAGQSFSCFLNEFGGLHRVLVVGAGDGKPLNLERAGGKLIADLLLSGVEHVTFNPVGWGQDDAARIIFGAKAKSWRIDKYLTKQPESQKPTLQQITVLDQDLETAKAWTDLRALADGMALTRELVSEPANIIYPESFVARCAELADLGVEITVLDRKQMEDLGMNALLGVAQGSVREPRIIAMRWDGTGGKEKQPVMFVGKGVTFDTGGISIKPAAGMEEMKWDMGGAGAVAGAMRALAGRKAKAHVVGICGLAENMPDGNAQRPGDVVTSMNGQTIEVINTDAEGRLVLCDTMHWGQETFDPSVMVDLATLTGAMIVSLGSEYAGCFSNDDGLADQLLDAGKASGDKLWRFPLDPAYDKLINTPIADMKNVGPRGAGSITAGQFLKRFVKDGVKWAHLDIAGVVWAAKPGPTWDKGATGYGVRLLDRLVADNFEAAD